MTARRGASSALAGCRVAVLAREHVAGRRGALVADLVPALQACGASAEVVHAETSVVRLDTRPAWDLVVLESGSPQALHVGWAAQAWGIPCVNTPGATRLARDKVAATAVLGDVGLPVPRSWGVWVEPGPPAAQSFSGIATAPGLDRVVVRAAAGPPGTGPWRTAARRLHELAAELPRGPYLVMEDVGRVGDTLEVLVAGSRVAAVHRPSPARACEDERGRPADVPPEVESAARRAGRALDLDCYGCDFVTDRDGTWALVDVDAFPCCTGVRPVEAILEVLGSRVAATARVLP